MGRYATKNTTSDHWQLDIRDLKRKGLLRPRGWFTLNCSRNGEVAASMRVLAEADSLYVRYRHSRYGSEWEHKEYPIYFDSTPCNYGGSRLWFLCPGQGCSKRVAVLYMGSIFACRHCYQLVYESQREQPYQRALSRAQKIRMRLGGSGSMADDFPEKPKGMHWHTYKELSEEYDYQDALSIYGLAGRLGMLG